MADTKELLICPACGKEMKKVFIADSNFNVDICLDGCGGILFDNREFEKFDEKTENADEILNAIKDKTFETTDETKTRVCPVCDVMMVKQGCGVENLKIDSCNVCGAKFLDNGELQKIRESKIDAENKTNALMQLLYKENLDSIGIRETKSSKINKFFIDFFNKIV